MYKIKKKLAKMKLKEKTILVVLLLMAAAVLTSSITFYTMFEQMRKSAMEKSVDSLAAQKKEEIENYLSDLKTLAFSMGYSSWMQTLFQQNVIDLRTLHETEESVRYFMGSISEMNGNIRISVIMETDVRLTAPEGKYLDYSVNVEEQSWYEQFLKTGIYVETGIGKGIFTKGDDWYMNIYYPINNRYSMEQMGILVFTLERSSVEALLEQRISGGDLIIEDSDGNCIADTREESDPEKASENRPYYLQRKEKISAADNVLTLTAMLDQEKFETDNKNIWMGFCIVLSAMTMVFMIIGTVFSRYLTAPILKCKEALLRIRDNEVGISLANPYEDEIGELIQGFNEMSGSLHELIERNKTISILQKETEYQMLLQQINPHFLYNTLEIINGLILGNKEKEAVCVCETLGRIFRYNLKQNKWVTVGEEMQYISQYLLIMKYKIPDLSVYYEVDQKLENALILKAILQPLVENSVRHGFRNRQDDCCLTISIEEEKEKIMLSVMDNGNGIERETYLKLLKAFDEIKEHPYQKKESSVHVGIWNVFQRLYLEYGEHMAFKIAAKEGMGTRITIYLPKGE